MSNCDRKDYAFSTSQESATPRVWNEEGFKPFRLEVLSPVFIGSGEDFSPVEYVIRKQGDVYNLYLIDVNAWLASEFNNSAVQTALNSGDMLVLRRLVQDNVDVNIYAIACIPIHTNILAETLIQKIKNPQSNSKAEFQSFMRNPVLNLPFIPGSSLKGAISTPIIEHFDSNRTYPNGGFLKSENRKNTYKDTGYKNALTSIFGKIDAHAMQALKVSDIAIPPLATALFSAKAKKIKLNDNDSAHNSYQKSSVPPLEPCEALVPTSKSGTKLYGRLHFDSQNGEASIKIDNTFHTWKEIQTWCNTFYKKRFLEEWNNFYIKPHLSLTNAKFNHVKTRIENLPENTLLLRVGRYSHIECMTVENRDPQLAKGYGKTRTLADEIYPFGWVLLHFCSEEEYNVGLQAIESSIKDSAQAFNKALQLETEKLEKLYQEEKSKRREKTEKQEIEFARKHQEQKEKLLEQERQAQEEAEETRLKEERKNEAKAKQEAEANHLATLSLDDQAVELTLTKKANPEQVLRAYDYIDTVVTDDETRAKNLAQAIKTFWQKEKKWKSPKASQQERVVKIEEIIKKL